MRKHSQNIYLAALILVAANLFIWHSVAFTRESDDLGLYFLDVGQGDSQLIDFEGAQILIDGGKGPKVLSELPKLMTLGDRYIDLVILTHPELDHFGGLIDVLKTYEIGLVITNGRKGVASSYADFEKVIAERNIPTAVVEADDVITYRDMRLTILHPRVTEVNHKNANESGLVILLEKDGLRALYTADIGFETEQKLLARYNLSAQILKVGHHGSKFSTGGGFLKEVQPKVAVIEVGKNSYGHPTASVLDRLMAVGSQIFRTDRYGTVRIIFDKGELKVLDYR